MATVNPTPKKSTDPSVHPRQDSKLDQRLPVDASPVESPDVESLVEAFPDPGETPAVSIRHKIIMSIAVIAPFLGFVTAIVWTWQYGFMGWLYLSMFLGGWFLTGWGITVGYHRMLSHRAFETSSWMEAIWAFLGAMAIEGSPLIWCATHRKHHRHSDKPEDPHSPLIHDGGWRDAIKGFVHAHCGWLFGAYWTDQDVDHYVPDLAPKKSLQIMDKYYLGFVMISVFLPGVIAGLVTSSWSGFGLGILWGGLARIFFTHHVTWSINSICHIFGKQEYDSNDGSRNNVIFGVLAHGEGWHNNHHAFPTSARHGLRWWQIDTSWMIIWTMQKLGLVWNVKLPSQRTLDSKRLAA